MKNTIEQIQIASYNYRGQIINDLIYLERLIDEAIARHLCVDNDRQTELMELILCNERIGFSNKVQVFEYIFKKHKSDFVSNNPKIFSDIKKLIEERNIIAHYLLDTSENGKAMFDKENKIGFVKFRNSTETLWRSQTDYIEFHTLTANYISAMSNYLTT
jgi:hypothetical protein